MALGPKVKKGRFGIASVYDIAPTILHMFNLPLGKKMDGRPLKEIFKFTRKTRYKTYIQRPYKRKRKKRDKEMDKKTLEEFKSLGYIE